MEPQATLEQEREANRRTHSGESSAHNALGGAAGPTPACPQGPASASPRAGLSRWAQARTRVLRLRGRVARTAQRRPAGEAEPSAPAAIAQGGPPRLLLIDEDSDFLHLARGILGGDGYLVDTAADAVDGLARALRFPPAAILLNIHMGGQDGLAVFATLRRHERTARVPVLALTRAPEGLRRPGDGALEPAALLALGFAGHIARPVDWRRLRRQFRDLAGQPTYGSSGSSGP